MYFKGRYVPVEGGEQEAIAKQAELRGKAARADCVLAPNKGTFEEVAEALFNSKRLRTWTRNTYREALDPVS